MTIEMTDKSLPKLLKRCIEKENEGYCHVTRIKKIGSCGDSSMSLHKKFDYTGSQCGIKFKVSMRKDDKYE
ncbi:hypothetical protein D3C84_853390 [compost metagenome]